ncbi:MAG: hypothetical protein GX443_06325 [Deltaproteobacteria bacterium]|nr:hypothetical protein [Deltaproteobacteria bacterium]
MEGPWRIPGDATQGREDGKAHLFFSDRWTEAMYKRLTLLLLIIAPLFIQSCASVHYSYVDKKVDGTLQLHPVDAESRSRVLALKDDLLALGPRVRETDALLVAESAVAVPMALANEYQLVTPPLWHNHLVNKGKRQRGLCFHWTKDLMGYLTRLDQSSFDFHWGVAHRETAWRYHSSVVVTAKGRPFEEGIVLDGWRHSGRLFWCPVKKDKYPWVPDEERSPQETWRGKNGLR